MFTGFLLLMTPSLVSPQTTGVRFEESGQHLGDRRTFQIAPGDLDGDGDIDLVVLSFLDSSHVWINDGRGRFRDSGQRLGNRGGHGAALGDLDGSHDLDLFLVDNGGPDLVFLNDGTGNLIDSGQKLGGDTQDWSTNVTLGDVDGDSDLDAFVTVFQKPGRLWANNGKYIFSPADDYFGAGARGALGDLDGDGDLDMLTAGVGKEQDVALWLNDGRGGFTGTGSPIGGKGIPSLADVDGDGDLDLLLGTREGTGGYRILVNQTIVHGG
jgi:hypothetical protein